MNYYKYRRKQAVKRGFNISAVAWIIIVTVITSIIGFIFFLQDKSVFLVALSPANIVQGKYLWTILTHMLVHANLFHLFVNMFSLYFVGNLTEKIIGKKRFLWFYIIAGIFAGLLTVALSASFGHTALGARIFGDPSMPMVGASGAIFGILGILIVLIPRSKVYLIAGPIFVIIAQFILGAAFPQYESIIGTITTVLIFVMIMAMFLPSNNLRKLAVPLEIEMWKIPIYVIVPLVVVTFFIELPIGNVAHFGGLVAGMAYGLYLRSKYKNKVSKLQKIFR